ncbi:helix-turn-helix domain-containing protein [Actinoplanes sp. NPDC026623]|uniref:helix-turn-helix domain-containing protein n=1 Tax=Actinoplanes sp. NPDC026623 TaxID=3155610 RepID=UPI00340204C7
MTMPEYDSADHPPQPNEGDERSGDTAWTVERIRALGLVTDIATAARIFGLSRAAAYDLAKRDQLPITVLRFGTRYRIPVAAILQALHLPVDDEQPPDPLPPSAT